MQVAKWGNSLAIRLPAAVVEALELKPGDDIEIHVAAGCATMQLEVLAIVTGIVVDGLDH